MKNKILEGIKFFIARQSIFTKSLSVYGYEFLFREDIDSQAFGDMDPTKATAIGFHLFQGYFFSKPKIVERTSDDSIVNYKKHCSIN